MNVSDFGVFRDRKVRSITLRNANGVRAELISYGATLKSLTVKDINGSDCDIVLGYDDLDGYLNDDAYFGATVGRVCNRIGNASFNLDGKEYSLTANNGKHHLHGGGCLSKRVWDDHEMKEEAGTQSVKFVTVSTDGEFGYPGQVQFEVVYRLDDCNKLDVHMIARSMSAHNTVVNLTLHPYFNLDPRESDNVLDHHLSLKSNKYLPVDSTALPTGEIAELKGDLSKLKEGVLLRDLHINGSIDIDNDFVLNCSKNEEALSLKSERSGIELSVSTSNPVIHLYMAQHLNNVLGKSHRMYNKYAGIAIEAQKHTNAINMPQFPSIILGAHETYSETISFKLRSATLQERSV